MIRKLAAARAVARLFDLHRRECRESRDQRLHDGRPGRRDQFDLRPRGIDRRIRQQLHRGRSGNGQRSVRALHGASANVERRANPFVHTERLGADRRANDIHHRVDRADLVKVNLLDRSIVNLRFGRAQRFEDADRGGLGGIADRGPFDDRRESPSAPGREHARCMVMLVLVRMTRVHIGRVYVPVRMPERVSVLMRMRNLRDRCCSQKTSRGRSFSPCA